MGSRDRHIDRDVKRGKVVSVISDAIDTFTFGLLGSRFCLHEGGATLVLDSRFFVQYTM